MPLFGKSQKSPAEVVKALKEAVASLEKGDKKLEKVILILILPLSCQSAMHHIKANPVLLSVLSGTGRCKQKLALN